MVDLISSLGLDKVEADPNALPDGLWPGVISKAEFVPVKKNNNYALAITFTVDEGDRKGASPSKWYTLGKDPVFNEDGTLQTYTPTMTDQQKSYFKKDLEALGVPESALGNFDPSTLVGKKVNFRTKKNDQWININFIELRYDGGFQTPSVSTGTPFEAPAPSAPAGFDPSAL